MCTKHFISVILFAVIIFVGCKKESSNPDERKITNNLPEAIAPINPDLYPFDEDPWSEARNENNPYDGNGYYHNKVVEYIFENVGIDSSAENFYDLAVGYAESQFGQEVAEEITTELPFSSHILGSAYFPMIEEFSIAEFEAGIVSLPVRQAVEDELLELLEILTDSTQAYYGTYSVMRANIIYWEEHLDPNLYSNEVEALLRTASIARYSMRYWYDYDQSISGWRWLKRLVGWALVGAADAIGGFIGSFGSPVGAFIIGGAGSALGFTIFKHAGWDPF